MRRICQLDGARGNGKLRTHSSGARNVALCKLGFSILSFYKSHLRTARRQQWGNPQCSALNRPATPNTSVARLGEHEGTLGKSKNTERYGLLKNVVLKFLCCDNSSFWSEREEAFYILSAEKFLDNSVTRQ